MNLTQVERSILANQLRIMRVLGIAQDSDRDIENQIKALEAGYPGFYQSALSASSEATSEEVSDETMDILSMYRAIDGRTGEPQNAEEFGRWLTFQGFDGNNDPHYFLANYVRRDLGRFSELDDCPENSHSIATLPKYRAMLEVWERIPVEERYQPSAEQVAEIIAARPLPRTEA